jgi:hypothetical protein
MLTTLKRIDEYLISSFYTAIALVANGVSEAYTTGDDVPRRLEPVDIILSCVFAAAVTIIFSFIRRRRFRILGSVSSLGLWIIRSVMGFFLFGISEIPDNNALLFWIISFLGIVSSIIAIVGQYLRHRQHHEQKTAPVEAVKVRFVS